MTNALDTQYQPSKIERAIYQRWEESGAFVAREADTAYCIMIPPPNVTGSLHMGHAFQDTVMDLLTRYHRMSGDQTLWQMGSDHAGIATQMVVERRLAVDNISRHDLGREKFIEKFGSGRPSLVALSPASCAAWAPPSIGVANDSPWTKVYHRLCKMCLSSFTGKT